MKFEDIKQGDWLKIKDKYKHLVICIDSKNKIIYLDNDTTLKIKHDSNDGKDCFIWCKNTVTLDVSVTIIQNSKK